MSIASTKSTKPKQTKKKPRIESSSTRIEPSARREASRDKNLPAETDEPQTSERFWQIAGLFVLVVAAFFRLYDLALAPLHHDEGVNGSFLLRLVHENYYHYDPANYHGPTLYYFALVSTTLLGLTTFAIRLVPVLFGLATIWLVLCFRRSLGNIGALAAGALIAVSPGAVYFSRYFIHESLFVFFTLGIVHAEARYDEKSDPAYLLLASSYCALLFATKETAIISAGVLLIALIATLSYERLRGFGPSILEWKWTSKKYKGSFTGREQVLKRFGGLSRLAWWGLAAIFVFFVLNFLFYSSFFTNFQGCYDALKTFDIWSKTGQKEHVHEWWTYVHWLWQEEAPLLILGGLGCAIAVLRTDNRFAFFCALWAFGICAAYSLVPYKTPWLVLNFIVPLAIMGGYAIDAVFKWARNRMGPALVLALGLALPAVALSTYQMITLNFIHYDDDSYPYVYAHTRRELLVMVNKIEGVARALPGKPGDMGITIVSPDYWPLPWYLRDFKNVGYYGRVTTTTEPVIIGSEVQANELAKTYGERYERIDSRLNPKGTYSLRPGVELVLYVRRDAAGSALQR